MIKNKLNEFEADWAALPQVEKDELLKLKNKTILISGHSIARCLCYALLYQNEAKALNIRVIFSDIDNGRIKELFSELVLRDDFDFVDCGDTKLLNEETFQTDGFMELLLKMKWTQEMGTMYDQDSGTSRWGCYMLAKTASSFSYKIGDFTVQASSQEFPTEVGKPINTNARIVN